LDIAKRVFQAHGADAFGGVVFRKRLTRAQLLGFFAALPPTGIAPFWWTPMMLSSEVFRHAEDPSPVCP
jgi:predicted cobalt transporter CbtA